MSITIVGAVSAAQEAIVAAGTYTSVTVDVYGRVTAGSNPQPVSHASTHATGGADAINPTIVTPLSLSASQNDYTMPPCDIIRLSSTAAVDITGLSQPNADGALRLIINVNAAGGSAITLRHENASSTASNRFRNTTGGDYVLPADGGSAILTYSSAISRWRIL